MIICEYGCGKEAKFPPGYKNKNIKNNKWCCSETFHKCEGFLNKNSITKKKPILDRFLTAFIKEETKNLDSIIKSEKIYNINLEKECWIWKKSKDRDGYGLSNDERNYPIQAHRLSYILFIGQIIKGKVVSHYCDTPDCVNPNHLFLSTIAENNLDRKLKNRSAIGLRNGMHTKPETRSFGNDRASSLWKVIYPDGREYIIKNLTKFCRDLNIPYSRVKNNLFGWKTELIKKFIKSSK